MGKVKIDLVICTNTQKMHTNNNNGYLPAKKVSWQFLPATPMGSLIFYSAHVMNEMNEQTAGAACFCTF